MTRLLAFGDLHLGHGSGYGRTPGDRLRDQAEVLQKIGDLADEHGVDLILNVGDTFEGHAVTPEQLDVFARFVSRMHMNVVAITGNGKHDAAMRDTNAVDIFRHIPGITVSSTPQLVDVAGATIATLPWVHPGRLVAAQNGDVDRDEVNREAAGLLVATARGLRAQIPDGRPAILALHGSISGAALPNGLPVDAVGSVPLIEWDELDALGFDAIVAGHIHKRQTLGHSGDSTFGIYVGSPMCLDFGETADDHGVWILDVDGEAGASSITFLPIESRPFVTIDHDVSELDGDPHNLLVDAIEASNVNGAIVRLRYRATSEQQRRIFVDVLRACALEDGAHVVKVEPDIVREDRARVDGVNEDLLPLEAFDLWAVSQNIGMELAARARERMESLLEAVA